jgi:hypothetical protein
LIGPKSDILVVDGFDRLYRHSQANINQRYTRDYIIEHLDALRFARPTAGIDFAQNEELISGTINLSPYRLVDWMLGREGSTDRTFDSDEQRLVENYLKNGGALLVSGTEIGWDLEARNGGKRFFNDILGARYQGDDAGSLSIIAQSSGPLTGIGGFQLDDGSKGRYMTASPDRLAPTGTAQTVLTYANTSSRVAGVANDTSLFKVMVFGFPIETIIDENARRSLVQSSVDFLLGASSNPAPGPTPGASNSPPSAGTAVSAGSSPSSGSRGGGCELSHNPQRSNPVGFPAILLLAASLLLFRRRRS